MLNFPWGGFVVLAGLTRYYNNYWTTSSGCDGPRQTCTT